MTRRALLLLTTAVFTTALAGCSDGTSPTSPFVVTGQIENRKPTPIPANARLLAIWTVGGSPDSSYIFGEGTINATDGTFRIEFQPPPRAALMGDAVGVAMVFATTDQGIKTGDTFTDVPPGVIGLDGQHAIIYIRSRPAGVVNWLDAFPAGYSVGVGVAVPGSKDIFQPASPSSPILIIDDLANISVVNWG